MKRASFTLFQPQKWMSLGQSTLMVLFVWCCLGINTASAQIQMPNSDTADEATADSVAFTAAQCSAGTILTFTDDGGATGNYADPTDDDGSNLRDRDTISICPSDPWSHVYVEFTSFDIQNRDFLSVFEGTYSEVNARTATEIVDRANGQGVSQINGGWVTASCNSAVNPSGCLTFIFDTDGRDSKAAGWTANVSCLPRNTKITTGNIVVGDLTCESIDDNGAAIVEVTIPAPAVSFCDVDAGRREDVVTVTVTNQQGVTCITEDISLSGTPARRQVVEEFGPGTYLVTYTLVADTEKTATSTFSVQLPSLICNDNIDVPFGSACAVQLTPDDILENPCDVDDDVLEYDITIVLGEGKDAVTLVTDENGYPVITADTIAAAGMLVCNAVAQVTITRTITAAGTCNNGDQVTSCTTTLTLNDQSRPFISLGARTDTLIACNADSVAVILAGVASAIDNCKDDIEVVIESVVLDETDPCFASNGKADTTFAVVTFMAADDCNNVTRLTDTITIIRPNEIDHLVKVADSVKDCDDQDNNSDVPMLAIGTYDDGEFTQTGTVALSENDYTCGYILQKRDVEIPGTDCGRKVYRYWSIVDWCTPGTGPSPIDTNFIEFTDTLPPTFTDDIAPQVTAPDSIQLGPFDCTYDINQHDGPNAIDNCVLKEVELHRVFRIEDGEDWPVPQNEWATLDCDSFKLMYVARDECHEQTLEDTTRQIVVIQDVTSPSAICTDELHVSVPTDEGARIHYTDIDAGSYDACGIRSIEIRKDGGPWGETVDITCEDVHNNPVIEMRVIDNKGNENICWMTVTAEDKIAPICGDLDDLEFACTDFHTGALGAAVEGDSIELTGDLLDFYNETFGNPFTECSDNLSCGPLTEKQYYRLTESNCGELDIDRWWTVTDWSGRESTVGTQHIDVDYESEWTLTFPVDVDLTCGDGFPVAATAEQIVNNGSCDLWALEVSEKTFEVPGDICMKVERTYELINWCVYQAGTDAVSIPRDNGDIIILGSGDTLDTTPLATVGRFTYVQILKLYSNEAPTISIANVDSCLVGEGDLEPFGMADVSPTDGLFECEEERTFTATGFNCADVELGSENFTWIFTAGDSDPEEGTGSSFTRVVSPKTSYTVEFWVNDGCGNSSGAVREFEFWDCKKPTPYVLHGLAIEIMQTGSIQLWANDLNQGSYDNCTVKNQLQYRLFKGDPVDGPQDIDAILDLEENVTFSCEDGEFGLQSVSFYVIDEENNWDVVGTYVSVQTNNGACTDGQVGLVSGKITNALGENVELVNVSVNSGDNTMATGATGEFQFNLALEGDYTITPEKNISPLNGVSTYDLVLISKHILGLEAFDSPYKYIAADVNKSGTITAFDMVQLRQLILNITTEFSNNTSWRFVDAKHEFTTQNPAGENFDEFMNINNLNGEMLDIDFIATKIGDVNGNAQANSLLGAESRTTNGTLNLNVTDRFVEAGQTVTVDFTSADIAATQGFQFTMDFAGLDLVELNEGVANANNFNTNLVERGVLTTSWNGVATDENLFSLTFTATTNGLLSELVSVNSDITVAEAYNTAGELLDVAINFNSNNVSAAFDLSQNTPNPFTGETLIGFNLPQAGIATLKVMDIQGKVLTVISQEGVKGYNQVTLNAKTLGATGVLYYQLESADNIATKKMIIID